MMYLIGGIILLGLVNYILFREVLSTKKKARELAASLETYKKALIERDKAMDAMQEAYRNAENKKKSHRTGDDAIDFKRSVELLRDVPGESGAD